VIAAQKDSEAAVKAVEAQEKARAVSSSSSSGGGGGGGSSSEEEEEEVKEEEGQMQLPW